MSESRVCWGGIILVKTWGRINLVKETQGAGTSGSRRLGTATPEQGKAEEEEEAQNVFTYLYILNP